MPRMRTTPLLSLALALGAIPLVLTSPHGGDGGTEGGAMEMTPNLDIEWSESFNKPNYFRHPSHVFWIYSHIISMVLAWFVLLPIGMYDRDYTWKKNLTLPAVLFSVVRSRYTTVAQFAFFALHA